MNYKLTIELIPSSSWFSNVRSILSSKEWDNVRKQVYRQADYKCEICGGKGRKHPVECHEIFEFDDQKSIQKLTKLLALCPNCHMVKHIGLAEANGKFNKALKHFIKINKVSEQEARDYIKNCFLDWSTRSSKIWKIDVSYLSVYGINHK
jgi:5-methylcytosine-specific restriction endonuclease McrA